MASTTVVDILTMDEIEQLNLLTGKSFEEIFSKGLGLGKATKALCWVLDKRNNPESTIEKFGLMNIHEINAFLEEFVTEKRSNDLVERMVYFCIATGMNPEQYRKSTVAEYAKFCEVLEERNG